ncbi:MAG: hypothetical protein OEM49_00015 [Myxococcales bacterium]|nr:hypothetical protein [Myxococcales bacterium]MDH5306964.1 hypothetical protein [Myxococcales bacterium]
MSDRAARLASDARRGVGLFQLDARSLLRVVGADRQRWLDGMLSNDVAACAPGRPRSGCYALLLTPVGRISADVHVLHRGEEIWLELDAAAAAAARSRLEKHIIADDVRIEDASARFARFALEGPGAAQVLQGMLPQTPLPQREGWIDAQLAGAAVTLAAFGWSGALAAQLFVPRADAEAVFAALAEAVCANGGVIGTPEALEVLRIEAGIPRFGAELGEDVLPAEAHLTARAVSFTKGCYTGQEIVARMDARDRVARELVGLHFAGDVLPEIGATLELAGRAVGAVTSVCHSARAGSIGLGYARREHAKPGCELLAGERPARVAALPFVADCAEA